MWFTNHWSSLIIMWFCMQHISWFRKCVVWANLNTWISVSELEHLNKIPVCCNWRITVSLSFSDVGAWCVPLLSWMWFCWSKWFSRGEIVPSALPTCVTAKAVLFTPRSWIALLQTRFRCSWWRSHSMFLPGKPWILTKRFHSSCSAWRGVGL